MQKCHSYLSLVIVEGKGKEEEGDPEEQLVRHLELLVQASKLVPRALTAQTHHLVLTCLTAPLQGSPGTRAAGPFRKGWRGPREPIKLRECQFTPTALTLARRSPSFWRCAQRECI